MTNCPKCGFVSRSYSLGSHATKCGVTLQELFFAKVNKAVAGGCWLFTGSIKPRNGYGHMRIKGKDYNAHRWSYEYHVGAIPVGMEVAHRCDVPACVNPDHLFLATHDENMADCYQKRRHAHGVRNRNAKLTEDQVRYIKANYRKTGARRGNGRALAREVGISTTVVYGIVSGRLWGFVK